MITWADYVNQPQIFIELPQ